MTTEAALAKMFYLLGQDLSLEEVKRLMQSMGQGVKADAGELDTMMIEWLGVGPIEEFCAAVALVLAPFAPVRKIPAVCTNGPKPGASNMSVSDAPLLSEPEA